MEKKNYLTEDNSPGHLFVVQNDLSRLCCDAWMLPTDDELIVEPTWRVHNQIILPPKPPTFSNTGLRVLKVEEWKENFTGSPAWLVNVGGINKGSKKKDFLSPEDIKWYIDGANQFFESIIPYLEQNPPRNSRIKHLVALPLVGTGRGGAKQSTGHIVAELLPLLYQKIDKYKFDIALVTITRPKFAAIELARSKFENSFASLEEELKQKAKELAALARKGELVLFLGSGISAGAGLPTWQTLLDMLAMKSGMSEEELKLLHKLDNLEQASVIEMRLGGTNQLAQNIAKIVQVHQYSLNSCLIAALPIHEIVTTNFNQMVEMASSSIGLNCAILPYTPVPGCDRWLLKMHGCVTHPEDIVITKQDYTRYASRRSALGGIVQSLLITRHMLFIGFSLNDSNFFRIVDDVRQALNPRDPGTSKKFGTVLNLIHSPFMHLLWQNELNIISMLNPDSIHALAVRKLEIFLDYLCSESTTTSIFLLKPQYDALLSDDQRFLRNSLLEFIKNIDPKAKKALEWEQVMKLMKELGIEEDEKTSSFIISPKT